VAITSNHLIQINATVIAGILVLLGITAQQGEDILKIAEENPGILQYQIMVQIIIRIMIVPFALSATIEVVNSLRNKERDHLASKPGIVVSAIGFIVLVAFFVIEIAGGLTLLYN
jgi:large-conductance mechanosensitive channel